MSSRYNPPLSPRGRYTNPARSSTGTFADPYYDSSYYARPPSPRSSIGHIPSSSYASSYYTPSGSSSSRSSTLKPESHKSRPRRNTNDQVRPNSTSLTSLPIRSSYTPHAQHDRRDSSAREPRDKRSDAYITQVPTRREHKKVYSVDDNSHKTQLVAERESFEPSRHRDSVDRGYNLTSGGRTYHSNSKPPSRLTDLGDDGYSYTDPASMYRDTEPAWRQRRSGSLERGARPSSMIVQHPARSSARELHPPPSTRGLDKIDNGTSRALGRSSPAERSRDIPKYDSYANAIPSRSSTTRQHAPAVHQAPPEHRRDTYHDEHDRRDRQVENKRHSAEGHFEDRDVASRGFGILPGSPALAHEHHALDRQPIWNAHETGRTKPDDRSDQYYSADHGLGSVRMPEPRMPEPRVPRDRDVAPPQDNYDHRPREREGSRQESKGYVPAAAGAAAATLGTAAYMNTHEKERERDSKRDSYGDEDRTRERDRHRDYDDRDRYDRYDDRRERRPEERHDERRDRQPEDRRDRQPEDRRDAPPPPPSTNVYNAENASARDDERRPRERRYEDDDRERAPRKAPSLQGSDDERTRHYVDREAERKKDSTSKEAALDPDEEYRRRIQQEADRNSRNSQEKDYSDSDRDQDRRRRKDERDRDRGFDGGSSALALTSREEGSSRYDERSSSLYDSNMVQEPESMEGALVPTSKSVQIVTPPKEAPAVRGILRKPTEKFPEDPEPIREGVAPHKDAMKGKDIPVGARWTRIDRRLVNPEALEQAKERFEERMDCVIVLRVLTKQEIQKLADRTRKIRDARDEEDRRDRSDRDTRSTRSSRDDRDDDNEDRDRDRDRRRRRDESDYDDRDRDRDRDREYEHER